MPAKRYQTIVAHYEACLDKFGDSHLGVDWPKLEDAETRYGVMLDVIRSEERKPVSLLDFGCGASHLYEYIERKNLDFIEYGGLDISEKFVDLSRKKFPNNRYYCLDVLTDTGNLPLFDYVIMNGVFTEKRELEYSEMFAYFQEMIVTVFAKAKIGIAFNVMSKQVDWERDDLFHLSFDDLAMFLAKQVSRHFTIRHDYRLYEYTVYVYR